jgi:hypothetical protein
VVGGVVKRRGRVAWMHRDGKGEKKEEMREEKREKSARSLEHYIHFLDHRLPLYR